MIKKISSVIYFLLVQVAEGSFVLGQHPELFIQKVDDYVNAYVGSKNFSGTVLVAKGDQVLYHKSFGFADLDLGVPNSNKTVYHIASVSKPFTAAGIMLLEQKGLLSLTEPVSKFIPEFLNGDKINIHHLLTHTSGIPNINAMPVYDTVQRFTQTPASLLKFFKDKPQDFSPGLRYAYSNSNYNILAYIIEKVSGESFGKFLDKHLFTPAGMKQTGHHEHAAQIIQNNATGYQGDNNFGLEKSIQLEWSSKTGNGSIFTTAEDLYRWNRALSGELILTTESKSKMFTKHIDATGYGYFIRDHFNSTRIYINGRSPGFSSYFAMYPKEDLCIVILSNNYIPVSTQMGIDIAAMLFLEKYTTPSFDQNLLSADLKKQLTGRYQFDQQFFRPNFIMTVSEIKNGLRTDWGELIPQGDLKFIERNFWSDIRFERSADGKIISLSYGGAIARKLD